MNDYNHFDFNTSVNLASCQKIMLFIIWRTKVQLERKTKSDKKSELAHQLLFFNNHEILVEPLAVK